MKHGQEESWEKETIEGPLTIIKRGGVLQLTTSFQSKETELQQIEL